MKPFRNQSGSLLIELLVSISIAVVFTFAVGSLVAANNRLVTAATRATTAVTHAKETMEQIVAAKNAHWNNLPPAAGFYRVERSGNDFRVVTGLPDEDLGDGFRRTVAIAPARRASGRLQDGGPDEDPNVRRVVVTVTWREHGLTRQQQLVTYLANWRGE